MGWNEAISEEYDVVIATCGYETRATFVISHLEKMNFAPVILDYECEGLHRYDKNKRDFQEISGVSFLSITHENFYSNLLKKLTEQIDKLDEARPLNILFDVSSCSRSVMAQVLLAIAGLGANKSVLSCAYALSAFDNPPEGELPSCISEPVIGDLAGWSDDLSKPPCAIISLGFEPGRALGTIDYLEVPEVRLFMPQGPDQRFENAVLNANKMLIEEAGAETVLTFNVLQPNSTYQKLDSLIYGLTSQFRPVIIPLGPKIFSAVAMVLAIRMFPSVCVWRTSSGSGEEINDRKASGEVAIFNAPPISL